MHTLAAANISAEDVTRLLIALAVLLGLARVLGEVARKLKQPAVLGEILAGVLLGATVLGNPALLGPDGINVKLYHWVFPEYMLNEAGEQVQAVVVPPEHVTEISDGESRVDAPLLTLSEPKPVPETGFISTTMFLHLSAIFLLLVAGLEVDLSIVWKQGKAALLISATGMVIPFVLGFGLAYALPGVIGYEASSGLLLPFSLFVGIAMSITALPVIAKILMDLNMFRSDMGMLIMSSAMVNDLLGWIGFAMVLAMISGAGVEAGHAAAGGSGLLMTIGLTLLFVAGMLTIGRWLAHKSLPFIQAHTTWPGGVLSFVMVVALFCSAITESIGIHSIFGAFIAGVAIGDSKHLREKTREMISQFITNIFAPIFFAGIGLRVNFLAHFDLLAVALVLTVAILGKVIGCYYGGKWAGLSKRESWAVGFGMSARGAMEIILGQLAMAHGLITEKLFVAIVVMAIATSMLAGPAMQSAMGRTQRRRLADFISEKSFAGQLNATDRRTAIGELAQTAAKATGIGADEIDEAVWQREQIVSTGLPNALAVPHGRLKKLKHPVVVVGQSNSGVDFDSPDGSLAEIVCLLLTPAHQPESQLEMLRAVAEAFHSESVRRDCLAAATLTEFKAALATSAEIQGH
ncbi:MAG: cation:proton antiporter [Phycisphaerales bacterium]